MTKEGCSFGLSLIRCSQASEGSLVDTVEHVEMVQKQLDAMIQRRARRGEIDPDEREEAWKASVRAYTARRREEMRAAWCEHHQGQAARLRAALEELIAGHEEQADRYRDQPEGD
jgi:hypothetical protein